jgi:hypothetical protein
VHIVLYQPERVLAQRAAETGTAYIFSSLKFSLTHSLTHLITHTLFHSLTLSSTHPLTLRPQDSTLALTALTLILHCHRRPFPLTHSLITHSLTHTPIHTHIHSLTHTHSCPPSPASTPPRAPPTSPCATSSLTHARAARLGTDTPTTARCRPHCTRCAATPW